MIKKLQRMRAERGFTLAELLVVVLIIAILATLAIVFFTGQTDTAKENVATSNLRSAYSVAQNLYVTNDGSYGANAGAAETALKDAIDNDTNLTGVIDDETPAAGEIGIVMDSGTEGTLYADGPTGVKTQDLP